MASGSRGLYGLAVLRPVEGGASRETEFVMGPFLEGSLALENKRRSGDVVKRDVQSLMKYVGRTTSPTWYGR